MASTVPPNHPRWDAFTSSFKQSNYITDFWNWFMTLMSKAAEMVLFGTVLYSGYQLLPGVPHVPATIDAAVFVIQQGALDIGGMGLLKLAKRAGLPRDAFPVRLGMALVVLMILNVALASIKHSLPMIPDGVFVGIETVLLIARAIVAVLFGHAIHALREEYSESTITIKDADELRQHMEELSSELSRVQQNVQRQLSAELSTLRENVHQQLSFGHESFQQYQEALAQVPDLKAHLQHIESSTTEELRQVKAVLEKQAQRGQNRLAEREQQAERPVLRALPSIQRGSPEARTHHAKDMCEVTLQAAAAGKFDARAFVFACLEKNPALKLAEIEQRARAAGQALSQPTASRYRKQFLRRNESASVVTTESSIMKAESTDESSIMKVQGVKESTLSESSANDERRVVCE
jgi:hypothetical protein